MNSPPDLFEDMFPDDPKPQPPPNETTPDLTKSPQVAIPPNNRILFYDFETVPDEDRFPRPTPPESDHPFSAPDAIAMTVEKIKKAIIPKATLDHLDAMEDCENQREKPRAGVLDAIVSRRNSITGAEETWRKDCSVSPFKCKIVALGYSFGPVGEIQAMLARKPEDEVEILRFYWKIVNGRRRCGYNVVAFDDLVAIARSCILGIEPTMHLDRRKYNNRQVIDIQTMLFPNQSASKCKEVAEALGLDVPAGDSSGADVHEWVEQGHWQMLSDYVKSDVHVERSLYYLLSNFMES